VSALCCLEHARLQGGSACKARAQLGQAERPLCLPLAQGTAAGNRTTTLQPWTRRATNLHVLIPQPGHLYLCATSLQTWQLLPDGPAP